MLHLTRLAAILLFSFNYVNSMGLVKPGASTSYASDDEYLVYRFKKDGSYCHDFGAICDGVLDKSSFSVVFHGVSGSGKSKLVEDLCGLPRGAISGLRVGEGFTSRTKSYFVEDTNGNVLSVIDTPGFGEAHRDRRLLIWEGIDVVQQNVGRLNIQVNDPQGMHAG